jgi:hypothetical protein
MLQQSQLRLVLEKSGTDRFCPFLSVQRGDRASGGAGEDGRPRGGVPGGPACVFHEPHRSHEGPGHVDAGVHEGTLKHAGYSKFYENIMQIRVRLTGIPARQFSAEEKDTLMKIFRELQEPFEKHRKQRKNFLSYSYVMHKICQLLGITGVLKYLLLPTLPDNKIATDNIWEKMCAEVGYEYVPTL